MGMTSRALVALVIAAPLLSVVPQSRSFAHQVHDQQDLNASRIFAERQVQISLHGAVNAMHEHCEVFETGGLVRFTFDSVFPVEFDIHHHGEELTIYPIKIPQVQRLSDQFIATGGLEYCFNFVNRQLRDEKWTFRVSFNLSPISDASR